MNRLGIDTYVKHWGLKEQSDDIYQVLQAIANRTVGDTTTKNMENESAASLFIRTYREGTLGCFTLDDV